MKKILLILTLFVAVGCVGMQPFNTSMVNQGEERVAGIGDTFFEHSEGSKMNDPIMGEVMGDNAFKYDLTILELSQEKIGLQYNEFIYTPTTTVGWKTTPGGWLVKQGYNKRFDYAVADGIVRFKGNEFEILSVENGQIKYRRIK